VVQCYKKYDKGYLRQAFDINSIKISDFIKTGKEETAEFLFDFLIESDRDYGRNEYSRLLDRYFGIHNEYRNNDFYILTKDWFDKDEERLIKTESYCYAYYFLIISADRISITLFAKEWIYD